MQSDASRKFRQLLPLYLACYALWLGFSALGVWLIFAARATLFDLAIRWRFNPWQVRAIDDFGLVTLGLVWLVGILLLEYHLRQGVMQHRLWVRAARVLIFEAAALGLCYGLQMLLT